MSLTDDSLVPQSICQNRFRMFKVSPAQYSARSDEITALRAAKSAPTGLRTARNNKKIRGAVRTPRSSRFYHSTHADTARKPIFRKNPESVSGQALFCLCLKIRRKTERKDRLENIAVILITRLCLLHPRKNDRRGNSAHT